MNKYNIYNLNSNSNKNEFSTFRKFNNYSTPIKFNKFMYKKKISVNNLNKVNLGVNINYSYYVSLFKMNNSNFKNNLNENFKLNNYKKNNKFLFYFFKNRFNKEILYILNKFFNIRNNLLLTNINCLKFYYKNNNNLINNNNLKISNLKLSFFCSYLNNLNFFAHNFNHKYKLDYFKNKNNLNYFFLYNRINFMLKNVLSIEKKVKLKYFTKFNINNKILSVKNIKIKNDKKIKYKLEPIYKFQNQFFKKKYSILKKTKKNSNVIEREKKVKQKKLRKEIKKKNKIFEKSGNDKDNNEFNENNKEIENNINNEHIEDHITIQIYRSLFIYYNIFYEDKRYANLISESFTIGFEELKRRLKIMNKTKRFSTSFYKMQLKKKIKNKILFINNLPLTSFLKFYIDNSLKHYKYKLSFLKNKYKLKLYVNNLLNLKDNLIEDNVNDYSINIPNRIYVGLNLRIINVSQIYVKNKRYIDNFEKKYINYFKKNINRIKNHTFLKTMDISSAISKIINRRRYTRGSSLIVGHYRSKEKFKYFTRFLFGLKSLFDFRNLFKKNDLEDLFKLKNFSDKHETGQPYNFKTFKELKKSEKFEKLNRFSNFEKLNNVKKLEILKKLDNLNYIVDLFGFYTIEINSLGTIDSLISEYYDNFFNFNKYMLKFNIFFKYNFLYKIENTLNKIRNEINNININKNINIYNSINSNINSTINSNVNSNISSNYVSNNTKHFIEDNVENENNNIYFENEYEYFKNSFLKYKFKNFFKNNNIEKLNLNNYLNLPFKKKKIDLMGNITNNFKLETLLNSSELGLSMLSKEKYKMYLKDIDKNYLKDLEIYYSFHEYNKCLNENTNNKNNNNENYFKYKKSNFKNKLYSCKKFNFSINNFKIKFKNYEIKNLRYRKKYFYNIYNNIEFLKNKKRRKLIYTRKAKKFRSINFKKRFFGKFLKHVRKMLKYDIRFRYNDYFGELKDEINLHKYSKFVNNDIFNFLEKMEKEYIRIKKERIKIMNKSLNNLEVYNFIGEYYDSHHDIESIKKGFEIPFFAGYFNYRENVRDLNLLKIENILSNKITMNRKKISNKINNKIINILLNIYFYLINIRFCFNDNKFVSSKFIVNNLNINYFYFKNKQNYYVYLDNVLKFKNYLSNNIFNKNNFFFFLKKLEINNFNLLSVCFSTVYKYIYKFIINKNKEMSYNKFIFIYNMFVNTSRKYIKDMLTNYNLFKNKLNIFNNFYNNFFAVKNSDKRYLNKNYYKNYNINFEKNIKLVIKFKLIFYIFLKNVRNNKFNFLNINSIINSNLLKVKNNSLITLKKNLLFNEYFMCLKSIKYNIVKDKNSYFFMINKIINFYLFKQIMLVNIFNNELYLCNYVIKYFYLNKNINYDLFLLDCKSDKLNKFNNLFVLNNKLDKENINLFSKISNKYKYIYLNKNKKLKNRKFKNKFFVNNIRIVLNNKMHNQKIIIPNFININKIWYDKYIYSLYSNILNKESISYKFINS